MKTWKWHKVCGYLIHIHIQLSWKAHRCREVGQQLRSDAVHTIKTLGSIALRVQRVFPTFGAGWDIPDCSFASIPWQPARLHSRLLCEVKVWEEILRFRVVCESGLSLLMHGGCRDSWMYLPPDGAAGATSPTSPPIGDTTAPPIAPRILVEVLQQRTRASR